MMTSITKPKDWTNAVLSDIVSFQTGKLDSNAAVLEGKYPFFTCSPETLRTNSYSFDTECVLLAGNNAVGVFPIKYFEGKFDAYQRTYVIQSKNKNRISNKYLFYALQPKLEYLQRLSIGSATQYLTLKILKGLQLAIPPPSEQKNILAILSMLDDSLTISQEMLESSQKLKQCLMQCLLTRGIGHTKFKQTKIGEVPESWELSTLNDCLDVIQSGSRPKGGVGGIESGIPSIGGEHVTTEGNLSFENIKYIPAEFFESMKNGKIQPRDVLIVKDGATTGKVAFVPELLYENMAVNEHVFILRGNKSVTQGFLFYLLYSYRLQKHIDRIQTGSAQPGINSRFARHIEIPPPVNEQEHIVRILSNVDSVMTLERKQKRDLNHLKKGLMQVLLTGKVRVKTNMT